VVDEHIARQTQSTQAEAASRERDRRQLAELTQQIDQLSRALGLATSRVSALAEEIRHERDSRPPVLKEIEEIQRVQTGVATRIGSMEQMVRRMSASISVVEASDEKQRADLARVDNQVKLVDLRVTREFAEIQTGIAEWKTRFDEQTKPVDGLNRLVDQLVDQRESVQARINVIGEGVDRLSRDLIALETQAKSDRAAIQRGAESVDALTRRLEATGGTIWQAGERISGLAEQLDQLRLEIRNVDDAVDTVRRQAKMTDDNLHLVEATQLTFALDLRTLRTDARGWSDVIEQRLDGETTAIVSRAESRYRRSVEQLRRSADEINQQVRELEADLTSPDAIAE
jgi:chromosome segregation ATPase